MFYVKDFLRIQGIELPLNSCQSLLFDYLSFCRSINVSIINNIISIGAPSAYDEFLLQQEIYSLLIRKCPELKYLDMIKIKHQLFYFPKANIRLDSLCELRCDTIIDSSYYYGLACVCQNIQRLIIINTSSKDNHGIVKLIEIQKNLKYFEWKDDFKEECFIDPYEVIFPILTKKANTLNHLIIVFEYFEYEHAFLLKVLPELHNLKTLIIDDLELNNIQLKKLIYRNLETIKIDYITINTATCIIKNSGGHLREILLKYYYSLDEGYFNEDSLIFIRTVYENCPLVEKKLEAFLIKWRGRPALSIITSDHVYKEENYVKLINKYKNDGVIKNFNHVVGIIDVVDFAIVDIAIVDIVIVDVVVDIVPQHKLN
ncbi:20026_t:CDS:2 [Rhizophagus irregularis]|nr:20026_t:CDS:2 [Rhizophagus irregularis]